jgi:hypothetical protein
MPACVCGCGSEVTRIDGRCEASRLTNRRVRDRALYLSRKGAPLDPRGMRNRLDAVPLPPDPFAATYSPQESRAIEARIALARAVVADAKRQRDASILPAWLPL